jgi:hypothetical protein
MTRRVTPLIIPALLLILLIFTDWLPGLRGPAPSTSEWYWPYLLRPFSRWWLPLLTGGGLLLIATWWLRRPTQTRHNGAILLALSLAMIGLQLSLIYAHRPAVLAELIDRTLTILDGGFLVSAAEVSDLRATLRDYPQQMPAFISEHARTHPPGLIIANNLTIALFERFPDLSLVLAQWVYPERCIDLWLLERPFAVAAALLTWAILPLLAAALTPWPGYRLAQIWLDEDAARLATLLLATLPSLLLFAPKVVQLYPPLMLLLFLALARGLARPAAGWLLLAGGLYSLLTFLSLGNLTLALPIGLYWLLVLWRPGRFTWRNLLTTAVPLGLGGLSIWLVYWAGWGVPLWAIIQTGLGQHYELVTLHRRYDWWLVWNLVDLLVFAGWPLLLGFGLALATAIKQLKRGHTTAVDHLALSLLIFLLALNMSGAARGEVGRLWLFFMPLLAIAAAGGLAAGLPRRAWSLTVGLQLALAISLGVAWQPVRPVIVVAERPLLSTRAGVETAIGQTFSESLSGRAVTLLGADLPPASAAPGDALPFTLFWQADGPTLRPYTVFNHLLNERGELATQQDNWPVQGQWPSTCWRPEEVISDSYQLDLPSDLSPGRYTLVTGLYDPRDGRRLPTVAGETFVVLGEVEIGD